MDWRYNTIWVEQLPPDEYKIVELDKGKSLLDAPITGSYFNIHKFKTQNDGFEELTGISSATYLEIHQSNIKSFSGISQLGKIKRLELSHCLKLESDFGLSALKNHIEWLHINTSRKFVPIHDLFELTKLKVLCLNSCGSLENLNFLKEMPNLLDFRFIDTNVKNGNLTPLLEHPSLIHAAFFDKRHYNLKSKEIDALFKERSENATEYLYKGDFRTFRYKALGVSRMVSTPNIAELLLQVR